jgi:hypothetical protein
MVDETILRSDMVPKSRGPKLSAERALPGTGVEGLVKIIKGYAVASNGGENQVNYKDVASATGLNPTVVSANNTFLTESGIILSPKYGFYVPSEEAVRFARESAWDETNAKSHLRRIVLNTWYGQVTVQNFATRVTLSRDDLRRVLGIKCGASESDARALNVIIDFLDYLDITTEGDDHVLRRGNIDELKQQLPSVASTEYSQPVVSHPPPTAEPNAEGQLNLSVVLNLSVEIDQLTPENAKKVRDWLMLVNGHPPTE